MQQISLRRQEQQYLRHAGRSKIVVILLLAGGGIIFGLQIWLSGEIATSGELINSYEEKKQELLLENARLREAYDRQSSLEMVQKQAESMGFVKVNPDSIEYVSSLDSFANLTPR
jgi:hypothetical protein